MGLLVLNVDHLPSHLLGPYGNSSVPTPTINAWAAHGVTLDAVFHDGGESPYPFLPWHDLRQSADLWLTGERSFCFPESDLLQPPAPNQVLIPCSTTQGVATTWEQSAVASYLERALSQWSQTPLPPAARVWIDLPLLSGIWDAPTDWRRYLAGEDEPDLFLGCEPPYLSLPFGAVGGLHDCDGFEPDFRMGYENAAGAMVMLLDQVLEWVQACVSAMPGGKDTIIVLTAETGYSLGEHSRIGSFPDVVWSEQTHVPLIVFLGQDFSYPVRIPGVQSQTAMLHRIWEEMAAFQGVSNGYHASAPAERIDIARDNSWREDWIQRLMDDLGCLEYSLFSTDQPRAVVSQSPNQLAVRTNAWSFVWKIGQQPQLFVRPDDRFEQNDVSSRCQSTMAAFQWYLPDLLHFFGDAKQGLPHPFRGLWRENCFNLQADSRVPSQWGADDTLPDPDGQNTLAAGQLPKEFWTNIL